MPLRFGDARTQALLNALVLFSVQTQGFTNAQLRTHLASLLGAKPTGALDALTLLDLGERARQAIVKSRRLV